MNYATPKNTAFVTLFFLLSLSQAWASNFQVKTAGTHLQEDVIVLNAQIGIEFDDETLEALNSGVALTLIVEMQIMGARSYIWDNKIAELNSRQELKLHSLSGQFVLRNLNSKATRSYRTLDGALEALGTFRDFPLLDDHHLAGETTPYLRLRAGLDIEALPSPLRPMAYLRSLVRKNSPWKTCQIER